MGDVGEGLLDQLSRLAAVLRRAGVDVSTGELIDAGRALTHLDLLERDTVRASLRAVMVKREPDLAVFDDAFDLVFGRTGGSREDDGLREGGGREPLVPPIAAGVAPSVRAGEQELRADLERAAGAGDEAAMGALAARAVDLYGGGGGSDRQQLHLILRTLDVANLLAAAMRALRADDEHDRLELSLRRHEIARALEHFRRALAAEIARRRRSGAGDGDAGDVLALPVAPADRSLLSLSTTDLAELRRTVQPLARQLAARIGRRRRSHTIGRVDLRRTVRASLQTGGIPLEPALRRRHPHRPDVVVLCDVSGSVAEFAQFTFTLLHAVHDVLGDVRSFAFVGGIAEMTEVFERATHDVPVRRILEQPGVVGLDGHSDYGAAFRQFQREYLDDVVGPRTTVIVTGDGRSNFREPGVEAFAAIAGRARRTYWLDPEPESDWAVDDSMIEHYRAVCDGVYAVSTARLLADAIAELV
ncbi:MAG: VWA domain-containing protein [Acidimicrobiia bacterium]